ncbi:MAG: hypothetical protein QXU54_00140 [Candidatus Micrarchaeia archaeon]
MMQKSENVAKKPEARKASPFMKMLAAGTIMLAVACGSKEEQKADADATKAESAKEMVCRMPESYEIMLKTLAGSAGGPVCREGAKGADAPKKVCKGTACAYVYPREKEALATPEAKEEAKAAEPKVKKAKAFSVERINIPEIPKEPKTLEELKMKPEDRKRLQEDIARLKKHLGIKD